MSFGSIDAQDRDIDGLIAADQFRRKDAPIGKLNANLLHIGDDVMIRENVSFLRDDDAGAESGLPAFRHALPTEKEEVERVRERHLNAARRSDRDDGRHDTLH